MQVRVVIDTNVYIDAGFRKDPCAARLFYHVERGDALLLFSTATARELFHTFGRMAVGAGATEEEAGNVLLWLWGMVDRGEKVKRPKPYKGCSDPSDDKFVACALGGKAHCIITRDGHLHSMTNPPVLILSPQQAQYRFPELR